MMRWIAWLGMLFACAAPVSAQAPVPELDATLVQTIERSVVMPDGAGKLQDYDRFYAVITISKRKVVEGVYVSRGIRQSTYQKPGVAVVGVAGAYIVGSRRDLPVILDGGCAMVTVIYDLAKQGLVPMTGERSPSGEPANGKCNGLA